MWCWPVSKKTKQTSEAWGSFFCMWEYKVKKCKQQTRWRRATNLGISASGACWARKREMAVCQQRSPFLSHATPRHTLRWWNTAVCSLVSQERFMWVQGCKWPLPPVLGEEEVALWPHRLWASEACALPLISQAWKWCTGYSGLGNFLCGQKMPLRLLFSCSICPCFKGTGLWVKGCAFLFWLCVQLALWPQVTQPMSLGIFSSVKEDAGIWNV